METTSPSVVRFGAFEANLSSGELRKFGTRVKLQDRPFQLLAILLQQPGRTVTREQLQSRLWPADTFVDFEHGLNTAINKLRQALSDDPDNPRFVETLPKRGYRFIAPVSKLNGVGSTVAQDVATPASSGAPTKAMRATPQRSVLLSWSFLFSAGGVLVLALIAAGIWFYFWRPKSAPAWSEIRIAPLNGLPYESDAAFSPDGNQVAFAWSGEERRAHVYVSQIGAETPRRLTNSPWSELAPVWSPDGKYIAFMRFGDDENIDGIYIASAVGGSERKVYSLKPHRGADQLDWSPDGNNLAFAEEASADGSRRIYLLSLDTLEKHPITSPPAGILGDIDAIFSPDGQNVAFVRDKLDMQEIFVVPVQGGTPRQITFDNRMISGVSWNADGTALIYSSTRGGPPSLWRIPASGGTPEPLPFAGGGGGRAVRPVVARKGNRLAFTNVTYNSAIWRAEFPVGGSKPAPPAKFIVSTELEEGPAYSPDGTRVAFQSTRTGSYEIWRCNADGTNLVQLTHFKGPLTGTPRWSPDGRGLVFDSRPSGHSDIFVINAEGGEPRQITSGDSENGVADWSNDGQSIYFSSSRGGTWEIWKASAHGGTPVQITHHGGFAPEPSHDGKFIYYAKGRELAGVWRVPVNGGEETKILDAPPATGWGYFWVTQDGIYYGDGKTEKDSGVYFYHFKTRRTSILLLLDPFGSAGAPGLSISPDGRYALYTAPTPLTVKIMLVENFRY